MLGMLMYVDRENISLFKLTEWNQVYKCPAKNMS